QSRISDLRVRLPVYQDLTRGGGAVRSARTETEDEKCESQHKSTRSGEMIDIPPTLLRPPVVWKGCRRPSGNPVIDGDGSNEREQYSEHLERERDCCEAPSGLIQVFER